MRAYETIVVGAGAAGVGIGAALKCVGVERFVLLERDAVGASFDRWARETRFISPSFTTNGFGMPDLNAVTPDSSPAFGIRRSHMSGPEYATYLRSLVTTYALTVETGVDVRHIEPSGDGFTLSTNMGSMRAPFVVWAAGEQAYPHRPDFVGAELCTHTAAVRAYADVPTRKPIVIGGFESGIDAAVHLSAAGRHVQVVDPSQPWDERSADPSESLSPFTLERLAHALATERLTLHGGVRVVVVERVGHSYVVHLDDGRHLTSDGPPLLATGYAGSFLKVQEVFGVDDDGNPLLTDDDESASTPGLFLAGPQLRHRQQKFCFIYKFRQRFAQVTACIAQRLGRSTDPLERYAEANMWLEDLSCCDVECAC